MAMSHVDLGVAEVADAATALVAARNVANAEQTFPPLPRRSIQFLSMLAAHLKLFRSYKASVTKRQ